MIKRLLYAPTCNSLARHIGALYRIVATVKRSHYIMSKESLLTLRDECDAIVRTADTLAVPKMLEPAAVALGDAAHTLSHALSKGSWETVSMRDVASLHDIGRIEAPETLKNMFHLYKPEVDSAYEYIVRAHETLRYPAGVLRVDVDGIEQSEGMVL